ncbi:hypothetical protein C8039_19450 [Halogeometricum sp. wsp3]|nr:hypothetical protein C8039_19450 [Halogeometricum sp. wsp3]
MYECSALPSGRTSRAIPVTVLLRAAARPVTTSGVTCLVMRQRIELVVRQYTRESAIGSIGRIDGIIVRRIKRAQPSR